MWWISKQQSLLPPLSFQSPAHSYSSYDSGKNESVDRGAEDLSLNRGDEDEDDHDDHDDSEKVNETDGVEAERLKAFNVSPTTAPPPRPCGLLFTTSLSCCCLLVNVDILETCLFNLQKDLKSTWNSLCQPDTRIAGFCLEFYSQMWAENCSCVVWVCMFT